MRTARHLAIRRRWLVPVAVVMAAAAAATAWGWLVWLPNYRPELHERERYGIDVSHHQGRIEWDRVAHDGIAFAYIKATEGGDLVDSRFSENWTNAKEAGLVRGAYHFFTLCTPGGQQARNFLRVVPDDPQALAPAVDLELAANCRARPDKVAVERELRAFLALVDRATGHAAVLYVGDDFEARYRVRTQFGRSLWRRRFLRRPVVDDWAIWQVGGFAAVDGVRGRVDLDVFRQPDG
ncbi:MAG TPA: GH25 family lysozyme [Actinomycetota bacterium]|nr:GH25 family lysozyme [Actinomycetota bacterium]